MTIIDYKLTGKTVVLITKNEYGTRSWEQLKVLIKQHFGDQKTEQCLKLELESINKKPNEINKIPIICKNTIIQYIRLK